MSRLNVKNLTMRFGDKLIQEGIDLSVESGTIFAIMGGSGCGKSTLLKHMIGLLRPFEGQVLLDDQDYWAETEATQRHIRQRFGVLFQSAALWTSMSVVDNVMVPLELKSPELGSAERRERAMELLSWVDMQDAADKRPSDLSGGMKKRAGLARAIAGEPDFLFFDEPSAGLDPISSVRLDRLITDLRDRTGAAVLIVSHELESLLSIADDGIFLDADSKRPIAHGKPADLKAAEDTHPTVRAFLARLEPSS